MTDEPTPSAESNGSHTMTRRGAMAAGAGAVALGVGAGGVAAAEGLNFESDFVPTPRLEAQATVGTHDRTRMASALEYVNNNGETVSLETYGGMVQDRPTDLNDDQTFNPITIEPAKMESPDTYDFPREVTDSNDDPVRALDRPGDWATTNTASVTAGGRDVEYSLRIEGDGEATFTNFDPLSDGVRKEIQFALVSPSGLQGPVEIGVRDSVGNKASVRAGPSLDTSVDDVFANSIPAAGVAVQREVGALNTSVGDITEVFVDVPASTSVVLTALNVERETKWTFGTRQITETDDEGNVSLTTETVEQPYGAYSITGIDTLGSTWDQGKIHDLVVDTEVTAAKLPAERVTKEFADDERYPSYDVRATYLYVFSLPSGYDISVTANALEDEQDTYSDRYAKVGVLEGVTDDNVPPYTLDDLDEDEENNNFTDLTSSYSGDPGDTVTLLSNLTSGDNTVVRYDVLMTTAEESEATAGGAVGGPILGNSGGGIWSIPGMIISALGLAGIYRWFTGGS